MQKSKKPVNPFPGLGMDLLDPGKLWWPYERLQFFFYLDYFAGFFLSILQGFDCGGNKSMEVR
jgi:hypothetical protein